MTTLEQVRGDKAEWDVYAANEDGTPVPDGTVARLLVDDPLDDLEAGPLVNVTGTFADGMAELVVPAALTAALPNTKRWLPFNIQLEAGGDGPWTLDTGQYRILPEVAL